MKLADHISKQLVKAGVDVTTDAAKGFLTAMEAVTTEIPDDMAQAVDSRFLTLDAAKNNHPEIKMIYQKQALDTIDKNLKELYTEMGFTQDVIDELTAESSTFKRVPLVARKIKDLEAKKASAGDAGKQKIQEQIDTLHAQLRDEQAKTVRLASDYAQKENDLKVNTKWATLIGKHKTVYDNLDPELKIQAIQVLVNSNLQATNGKVLFDDNGNFLLKKKDDTNYFDGSNNQLTPEAFLDGLLSRNKILVTNNPATPPGGGATQNPANPANPRQPNGGNGGNGDGNSATVSAIFKEHREQALKDFKGPKVGA